MFRMLKGVVAVSCLLFLIGCESGEDTANSSGIVVEDEALRNAAIDFISNAGDRVFFAYDSSSVSKESQAVLDRQANWLKQHSDRRILIEGHCDDRGTREYNLGLGERRADAAARYLMDQGLESSRVRTISYGKDRPIAVMGSTDEVRRMNRVGIAVIE